ncbi:MAG: glutamate--cysteine ligase [Betaproteobacteria bacterium]|nr:glutamate--cysteine ligase [Betaproteobacteria bacterium]
MLTSVSAPLKSLERRIVSAFAAIESWLREEFSKTPPAFYCSVDLRNNGQKIASIDANLFPGGFNNLPPASHPLAAAELRRQVERGCPNSKSVLLIPENHTRNLAYLDNVAALRRLFELAGIAVLLGRLDGAASPVSASGHTLEMLPVEREGGRLICGGAMPCAVVLNNDLSGGLPQVLQDLDIPTMPAAGMGWAVRRKSAHFFQYRRAAEQLAELLGADAWLLCADFSVCDNVNFHRREGMECLAAAVEETLSQIGEKYRQHGVSDEPFVVLKADRGTYGMGVLPVRRAEEVFALNRKQRNAMAVGKDGAEVSGVLIQEGINTADESAGAPAEPVVYMVGESVVGGFYRENKTRARHENLNSRGMSFSPLPFDELCGAPREDGAAARLYVYGVLARLAALASAREAALLE